MMERATVQQDCTPTFSAGTDGRLKGRIERAWASAAMRSIRSLLTPLALEVEQTPIIHKYLTRQSLRLIFPVVGGPIQLGTVASVVCLYDCPSEQTLYAHPMHAGPNVNPLLKHLDGPMASPKAQRGKDGERATARIIAHKEAIWHQFLQDQDAVGPTEASSRWRKRYYWALRRLYFCTRCTSCRWGSPFFDGPDPDAPPKSTTIPVPGAAAPLTKAHGDVVGAVLSSEVWKIETAYAQRGGFEVSAYPRIIRTLGDGSLQLIFPTNAALIQGGALVAVSVIHSTARGETVLAQCLSAGSEPEIHFLLGDKALGLPLPGNDPSGARTRYATWRLEAWLQFWLDELENGIAAASERWLRGFWLALEGLFSGNDISMPPCALGVDRGVSDAETSRDGVKGALWPQTASEVWTTQRLPIIHVAGGNASPAIPFETLQNTGSTCFAGHAALNGSPEVRANGLSALMVNLGRRCNQSCGHCYVDAGPDRTELMSRETVDMLINVLRRHNIGTLDITGGAPEMNPHFRYLARTASKLCERVISRCNLTILLEPGREDLAEFLAEYAIEITASMPHWRTEDVDRQRGRGVFDKSIEALRRLGALGYGRPGTGRILNLVYNPGATDLAPSQQELERRFKHEFREKFGIVFNRLFAMNNMPVNRFREQLVREGCLESYMSKLVGAFNSAAVDGLMCRHSLSVGWDGRLHDCDFNQAADVPLSDGLPNHIRDFDASVLGRRAINTAAHCFGCSAGYGSSCSGALASTPGLRDRRRNGRSREAVRLDARDPRGPL